MKSLRYIFYYVPCLYLLIAMPELQAQTASAKGDRFFDQNQFEEAIYFYKKDTRSRNRRVKEHATQRLADCYRITGNFLEAEKIYKKILSRNRKSALAYLNYGLSLMNGARYREAAEMFREYLQLVPDDKMGMVYAMSCDSALKWFDETLGREVRNLYQINTKESEFAPVVHNGSLLFLSARKGSKRKLISFDGTGDIPRLDFYSVGVTELNDVKKLQPLNELNTVLHEGPACYSPDGMEMYFTKTVKGSRDDYKNEVLSTLQVFRRNKDKNGIWSEPESAFSFNSTEYSVGHPSMSSDGQRIYFMSDMPGGYGKTDIYYAERQKDGSWGKAQNAGPQINTFAYELFPSVSEEGYIYFASNGHPGMGQLDIFRCAITDNKPGAAQNLKPPVNSISNDFGITFYGGTARGFFSSDRFNGKGAEDIYAFSEDKPLEMKIAEQTIVLNDYYIFDNTTYEVRDSTGGTNLTLKKINDKLVATINENVDYIIEAKQYGQVISKIQLRFNHDRREKSVRYELQCTGKPLQITGLCFLGLHPKTAQLNRDPKKAYSDISGNRFAELEMSIDEGGVFNFKVLVEPGHVNVINSMDVIRFEKK